MPVGARVFLVAGARHPARPDDAGSPALKRGLIATGLAAIAGNLVLMAPSSAEIIGPPGGARAYIPVIE